MKVYACRDCGLSCAVRTYPGFPTITRMLPTDDPMRPNAGWTVCCECFQVRQTIGSELAYEVQP